MSAQGPGRPRSARGVQAVFSPPHPSQRSLGFLAAGRRERGSRARRRIDEARVRCPYPALLYGDAEKPAESGGSQPPRAAARKAACTCDQKPCSCSKVDVNYAFLHATGKDSAGRPCPSLCPAHRGPCGSGAESRTGASRWRRRRDLPESSDKSEKCGTCPLGPSPRTWPRSSKRALRPWRSSPSAALGMAGGR